MSGERRNALPNGYQFEGYRIDGVLGAGGFGMTYRATEVALDRTVAIKEFLPGGIVMRDTDRISVHVVGATEQRDFEWGLAGFRKEAATLVTFRHPNIVAVYRYFEANGTAYMVMAYEEGNSLGAILARHPWLDESEIREILVPLLDGLARVHDAGFLHRDIKPDNIYIRADGSPVLLDFGAARQALGEKSRSMTSIFTAGYAPFEQYSSRGNQGPWTDIYALGAVLYRCVTGEKPPEAPDRIRDDPCQPAAQEASGRYAPGFLAAIDHALKVDERERPQSVAAWRTELGLDAPAALPAAPAKRRNLGWVVAAIILLAAGAGAAWYVTRPDDEGTRLEAQMKALQQRAATAEAMAKAEGDARKKAEADAEEHRKSEEAARLEMEKDAKAHAEAEAKRKAADEAQAKARTEADAKVKAEAAAKAKAKAEADAKAAEETKRRAATATQQATTTQQAAVPSAGAAALKALVIGKTAYIDRPVPGKPATAHFEFAFHADGTLSRKCQVVRKNGTTGECERPDSEGAWTVEGDRLCIGSGARHMCFTVAGSGEHYVFRQVSGDDRRLGGDVLLR